MLQIPVHHSKMCRVTMLYLAVCAVLATGCSSLVHKFERMDLETAGFKPVPEDQSLVTDPNAIKKARQELSPFFSTMPITPVGVSCRMTIKEVDQQLADFNKRRAEKNTRASSKPLLTGDLLKYEGLLRNTGNKDLVDEQIFKQIDDEDLRHRLQNMTYYLNAFSNMSHATTYTFHALKQFANFSLYSDGKRSTSVLNINSSFYRSTRLVIAFDTDQLVSQALIEKDGVTIKSMGQMEWFGQTPYITTQNFETHNKITERYSAKVIERFSEDDPTPKVITIEKLDGRSCLMTLQFDDCQPIE